jgi:hypothetical protein
MTDPLAYAGHYAYYHAGGTLDWLLDMVVPGVVYGAIGRLMRSMTLPEARLASANVVVALPAYRGRRT